MSGILSAFGIKSPFLDYTDDHRNAILGIASGLLGSPTFSSGLSQGFANAASAAQADNVYQTNKKAEAERQKNINQTAAWISKNYPQYSSLPADEGFQLALKAQALNADPTGTYSGRAGLVKQLGLTGNDATVYKLTGKLPKGMMSGTDGSEDSGPFGGTSMDAQIGNILLRGDPSSADYAYAYQQASQPKITFQTDADGSVRPVYQTPDMSAVRKPTYGQNPATTPNVPIQQPLNVGSDGGLSPAIGRPSSGVPSAPAQSGVTVGQPLMGAKPTEAQQRLGLLSSSLGTAAPAVLQNWDALSDTKEQIIGLGGALTKPWQSDAYQQGVLGLQSAISDIVPAISGAAFSSAETQEKVKAFTPQIGDKPGALKLKKQLFISYIQGIAKASNDSDAKAKAQALLDQISAPSQPTDVSKMSDDELLKALNG